MHIEVHTKYTNSFRKYTQSTQSIHRRQARKERTTRTNHPNKTNTLNPQNTGLPPSGPLDTTAPKTKKHPKPILLTIKAGMKHH